MTMKYYYSTELNHHGILGQKWGVRRFQNEDGSYTEAGKRRRRSDSYSDDYKQYKMLKKKNYKSMSNKELQDYNNRARLEQEYHRLKPNAFQKGLKIVAGASVAILTVNQLYQNSDTLIKNGKKILDELSLYEILLQRDHI